MALLLIILYICKLQKPRILRYFIEIAYKGTNYHGWQIQPNASSIQECINKAFSTILRTKIEVVGAGRTDTGVHAEQFFAHFDIENGINTEDITYKSNSILPYDISVYSIFKVNNNKHARFDAISRTYEYRIFLGHNPFFKETTWQLINKKLNVHQMNQASEILLKYRNFKCFSRSNTEVKTYNCKIRDAKWKKNDKFLTFHITADRFLRNMVRAIVGTMIEIGEGKIDLNTFEQIIENQNRCNAGPSAPSQGLFLKEVLY